MDRFLGNAKHWRDRAEETRLVAEDFRLAEVEKKRLLKVAEEYERLAERAVQWQTIASDGRKA